MSWLGKWDRRNQEALERAAELHRVVAAPDGTRYEVIGLAEDWGIATGSALIDLAILAREVFRRLRDKEWTVSVWSFGSRSEPILTRPGLTRQQAVSTVAQIAGKIAEGHLELPND
jgi:hypothetical protein